jgi:hypothetical protein
MVFETPYVFEWDMAGNDNPWEWLAQAIIIHLFFSRDSNLWVYDAILTNEGLTLYFSNFKG